ncbi:MAG: hypothetical protein QOE70_879 [Chthoniobacter sp.]|jgi:hypothetical protein|nr:hypothetical protein [Chthoniobacter sp.]
METASDTPDPQPAAPIARTASEIARDWGCARQYAARKIKEGCPTDSLEAARAWRLRNSKRGVGFRSRRSKPGEAEPELEISASDERSRPYSAREGAGDGAGESCRWEPSDILGRIEQSLVKARQVEEEAHRLVAQAQRLRDDELIAIRISAYNKALEGRLKAEEKCVELLEKLQVLITMDFAKQLIRRAWVPLLTRLRSIPKRAAVKANPHDDVHAEQVISIEIEDAIREARGAFAAESAPALVPGASGEATLT